MSRWSTSRHDRGRAGRKGDGDHRRLISIGVVAVGLEMAGLWLRARRLGGNVVARCRQGHLFTMIWIPGGSVKALRLGWWRFQRCPVGEHWSLVTPVKESDPTEEERRLASEHKDIRIP